MFCSGPLPGVLSKAEIDEFLESGREVALQCRRGVLRYEKENFHRVDIGVGGLSIGQLKCSDTQRPYVGLAVVARLLDHLRSHPERRSNKGVLLRHGGRKLARNTKVGKFYLAICPDQYVRRCKQLAVLTRSKEKGKKLHGRTLYVSVQLMVVVEIGEAHEQLLENDGDFGLCYGARLHQVCTAAARAEFHDDPQVGASQIGAIVLCDVGRVHARENHNLAHYVVDLVFGIFHVNDLDGDRVARPTVKTFVDFAKAAAAYAFLFCVERVGVDGFVSAYLGGHGGETGAGQGGAYRNSARGCKAERSAGELSRAAQRGGGECRRGLWCNRWWKG